MAVCMNDYQKGETAALEFLESDSFVVVNRVAFERNLIIRRIFGIGLFQLSAIET